MLWAAIVAILSAVYFWSTHRPAPVTAAWIAVVPAEIKQIEIIPPGSSAVVIEKQLEGWAKKTDTGYVPVDSGAVNDFIDMASKLESSDVVTYSPEKYSKFDMEDTSSAVVRLMGVASVSLRIGKSAPDATTYMRRGDEKEVWAVKGYDPGRLGRLVD